MRNLILLTALLLPVMSLAGEMEEKPRMTPEQVEQLKTVEEKYKDNPGVLKVIEGLKTLYESPEETTEPATQQVQGSREVADAAYMNKDYETALSHYEALAAEGDADASLIVGTMYEQGLGTERDPAAAHAWYKIAAEADDERGDEMLELVENTSQMDEQEMARADELYEEINKKLSNKGQMEEIGTRGIMYQPVKPDTGTPGVYDHDEEDIKSSYRPETLSIKHTSTGYTPNRYKAKDTPSLTARPSRHYRPLRFRR